jgi:hypothetical protein
MYGTSRKYSLAAENEIAIGNNAFLEVFLPSVASKNNLTCSYTALPVFRHNNTVLPSTTLDSFPDWITVRGPNSNLYEFGGTFHCTGAGDAHWFYQNWMDDSKVCLTNSVIHPVKL